MNPKQFAYIAVVVFFRTGAIVSALYGLFLLLIPLIAGGFGGSMIMLRVLLVYLGAAGLLWFLAKPIAALVVNDLDREGN